MTSKPAASRTATSSTGNVRRNLFHHQLSRRPTSASTSTSGTTLQESMHDDSSDIVVRDRNGKYDVQIPILHPVVDEDQAQEDDAISEKEKLDAMLLERYKDRSLQPGEPGGLFALSAFVGCKAHVGNSELLAAVQASLRRKVASLDDDNWMYEAKHKKSGV